MTCHGGDVGMQLGDHSGGVLDGDGLDLVLDEVNPADPGPSPTGDDGHITLCAAPRPAQPLASIPPQDGQRLLVRRTGVGEH
jgi:hypothetical protein